MTGHLIERFVDLTDEDINQWSCFVCKNILMDPVVAQCCQQVFCRQCIQDWLGVSPNCPVSNEPLTADQLVNPSLIIQNLLKQLMIRCDNQEKGCDVVMQLRALSAHIQICPFRDNDCLECPQSQCIQESGHNCIQMIDNECTRLKALNSGLKRRNDYRRPVMIDTNLWPQHSKLVLQVVRQYARSGRNMQSNSNRIARVINRYFAIELATDSRGHWRCSAYCQESGDANLHTNRFWCSVRYCHALFNIQCQNPDIDIHNMNFILI